MTTAVRTSDSCSSALLIAGCLKGDNMTRSQQGWYHADGDPPNTLRFWDGNSWAAETVPDPSAIPPPRPALPTPSLLQAPTTSQQHRSSPPAKPWIKWIGLAPFGLIGIAILFSAVFGDSGSRPTTPSPAPAQATPTSLSEVERVRLSLRDRGVVDLLDDADLTIMAAAACVMAETSDTVEDFSSLIIQSYVGLDADTRAIVTVEDMAAIAGVQVLIYCPRQAERLGIGSVD